MGISVFWEIAKGAAQTMSFKELCIKEGFIEKRRDIGTMLIGVDACLWITQSQAVFHKPRHAQMGKNPELKALFYKLAILNQAGVSAVFAFDGSDRPSIKRDKQVKKKPNWLVAEFIKLIELYGFHYHMAPGEADADLGYLDEFECIIDGILTDDGDVALFGARRILRRQARRDHRYSSESLQKTLGLTRGGLLLLAILGVGTTIRWGLLVAAVILRMHLLAADSHFLVQWRQDLRIELATNSRGFLRNKQIALSTKIPDTFPSLRVLHLYVRPVTSWSDGFVPPATENWTVKLPDLPGLAKYCKEEFGWKADVIVDKFQRLIFSGLCTRRLTMPFDRNQQIHDHVIESRIQEEHPPLSAFLNIMRVTQASATTSKKYQVKVSIGGLSQWTVSRLGAPTSAAGSASATANKWIAAPLVEQIFPLMVNAFNKALVSASTLCTAVAAVDFFDIPDSPMQQPVATKFLGSVDLTLDEDKGEGGSGKNIDREVIDLTENSDIDEDIIDLD
ncbi:PIN domain-like protein [Mycena leptocephala]|nr:PIN domain-like protein [Mycena leptocephala]